MASQVATLPSRRVGAGSSSLLLLLPAALLLSILFIAPLGLMVNTSLREGVDTYTKIFTSPLYAQILWNTIRTAVITTLLCLMLAYPYAYVLNRARPGLRMLLMGIVLLPFWTSLLVRSFAWVGLLQDAGLINTLLQDLGLIDHAIAFIRSPAGILIGMVHVLLPYMVLPLVNSMGQIDDAVLRAAHSFGAGPWKRFQRVFLPLSLPGVVAGSVLVFVLSLGFYITPALLGGPSDQMLGETIVVEVTRYGPVTASALAIILLAGTLVSLALLLAVRSLGTARKGTTANE